MSALEPRRLPGREPRSGTGVSRVVVMALLGTASCRGTEVSSANLDQLSTDELAKDGPAVGASPVLHVLTLHGLAIGHESQHLDAGSGKPHASLPAIEPPSDRLVP